MNNWIVVIVTLFFSALCSGLEIAFNSINRLQLEVELTKNTFSARLIRVFLKDQSRFITSLLLGNNIALIILFCAFHMRFSRNKQDFSGFAGSAQR